MKHLIEEFASSNLFGKDNYEYYARVTGRVLRVQGEWICSFQYPPPPANGVFPNEYVALERYLLGKSSFLFYIFNQIVIRLACSAKKVYVLY